MKKITISGLAGSGKSTIGKMLAEELRIPFISAGEISRKFAHEAYRLNINQFQELCNQKPEIDKDLDGYFCKVTSELNEFVIDYRLGRLFIPDAFHLYLNVSDEIAANRIQAADRYHEFESNDLCTKLTVLKRRNNQMRERFYSLYGFDFTDPCHYNLIVEMDCLSPSEAVKFIYKEIGVKI
jgi:cytidylate kinase